MYFLSLFINKYNINKNKVNTVAVIKDMKLNGSKYSNKP